MASKLHIEHFTKPLCGRQLSNIRDQRAQVSSKAVFAPDLQQFLSSLDKGKSCRHCAREAGLLPRVTRTVKESDEGEEE